MLRTKTIVASLALAAGAVFAPLAQAATWVDISNPSKTGYYPLVNPTFTYGPVAADRVFVYDGDNLGDQSPATMEALLESKFGLPASGAGSISMGAGKESDGDLTSAKSGSFIIPTSYDYLAIHYGQGELLFHFSAPVAANSTFTFGGLPHGISNFRAFLSEPKVSAVPEPETYGMLLSGLALMGVVARRRARK